MQHKLTKFFHLEKKGSGPREREISAQPINLGDLPSLATILEENRKALRLFCKERMNR